MLTGFSLGVLATLGVVAACIAYLVFTAAEPDRDNLQIGRTGRQEGNKP